MHSHKAEDVLSAALVDTKANILDTTPSESGKLAYATDTNEFYLYDGSDWKVAPLELQTESSNLDMGAYTPGGLGVSDKLGYGSDYISDKSINYCTVGSGGDDEEGAIRLNSGTFQIYTSGSWQDIVINYVFREDDTGDYELEHQPVGFDQYYEITSGNIDTDNTNFTDMGGKPIVQQYSSTMGAYQFDLQLDGGSF